MIDKNIIGENKMITEISLQDVKSYMRIDFDDEENDKFIGILVSSGRAFIETYLGYTFQSLIDSNEPVPLEFNISLYAIVEYWYKNRGVMAEDVTKSELPYVFAGILNMHRNWQVGDDVE